MVDLHILIFSSRVRNNLIPLYTGYLHIGHSKAIAVNFGFAQYHKGHCYLRYDDTNPEAEEQVYLDSILDIVRWLGFEPWKITYSSDHFQKLYDLAEELTRRGKAYMCYCTGRLNWPDYTQYEADRLRFFVKPRRSTSDAVDQREAPERHVHTATRLSKTILPLSER